MTVSSALRSWTIVLPGSPPSPNQEERGTFGIPEVLARKIRFARQAERKRWKQSAFMAVRMHDIPKLARIRISVVFFRYALNRSDWDGDVSRCKHVLDGIVAAGVVKNDTRKYVEWGDVEEQRGKPTRLEMTIEELEPI